jgi:predicted DNA-binding protein with PD1-like motif
MFSSNTKIHVFRLTPHQDLKKCILHFAAENKIDAGILLSCVGSLEQYHIRFANQKEGTRDAGHFEIISLTGTLSVSACHLHMAVSDGSGKMLAGHLLDDNLVCTTAEIAIVELDNLFFERAIDPTSGYHELIVKQSQKDE